VAISAFDSHVAYRFHPELQGWLDVDEAGQLRDLVDAYDGGDFPSRVRSGLRRTEAVVRERVLEDARPLCVGGIQAMLKVGRDYARAQFVQRASAVAVELEVTLSSDQSRDDLRRSFGTRARRDRRSLGLRRSQRLCARLRRASDGASRARSPSN
jgi:hypothetical protein